MDELKDKKYELRENYYKSLLDFEKQKAEVRQIEWMTGIKERLL